jgi:hypothetical protein
MAERTGRPFAIRLGHEVAEAERPVGRHAGIFARRNRQAKWRAFNDGRQRASRRGVKAFRLKTIFNRLPPSAQIHRHHQDLSAARLIWRVSRGPVRRLSPPMLSRDQTQRVRYFFGGP